LAVDTCDIASYDEVKVERVKRQLADHDTRPMIVLLKALADDTRAKIAYALCREEELCVCDVAQAIGTTVANASHHLRFLKQHGLAKYRKEGKMAFYSLDDEHVKMIIELAMEHGGEGKHHGGAGYDGEKRLPD
jgi:DNA-binding transcriptional ArsR family regulator